VAPAPHVAHLKMSRALARIVEEAEDIARQTGARPHSGHVLLAVFVVKNEAEQLLQALHIDEDDLLEAFDPSRTEGRTVIRRLLERAALVAASCGASEVGPLHLLVAMTREREAVARGLLERAGQPGQIRSRALAVLTGALPQWTRRERRAVPRARGSVIPSRNPRFASRIATAESDPPDLPGLPTPAPAEAEADARPSIPPLAPEAVAEPGAPSAPVHRWALDPDIFPLLTRLGRNLSAEAAAGRIDPILGRRREIEALVDILGKRRANNPCLVGEPGVGKTAVVEALALHAVEAPPKSRESRWVIVSLDVGSLLVGTHLRGSFSEKLQTLREEVKKADGRIIIFFDELHTLIGAGTTGEGPLDAANELKAALARGEFPCIGATTHDEFRKYIESDPALARRFVPVTVREPSPGQALDMLYRAAPAYSEHHGVGYTEDALRWAVRLAVRYIPDRHLPDKAIALLDLAGSRAARSGAEEVDPALIAQLVAERTGLPVERLLITDHDRLLHLERHLHDRIVGHRRIIERVSEVVRRHAAGFGSDRPQGAFLFLGPTGVGKTELAKALAEVLYGRADDLIRFDLAEFSEPHSIARLIGAPPGYVGFEEGGQLTEAIRRRPGRVVLFDEVEKAHPEVLQILLSILDEGRLTDSRGHGVSFSESIIVLTSNLGADAKGRVGFDADDGAEARVLREAARAMPPELWGRIDDKLVFSPLDEEQMFAIARSVARASSRRLHAERGIRFELDAAAIRYLLENGGHDPQLGARPLRAVFSRFVEGPIARRILEGRLHADEEVAVTVRPGGGLCFSISETGESLSTRPMVS
jgi:ATP-dependent Clp protease ATP-binding subunit ClpC